MEYVAKNTYKDKNEVTDYDEERFKSFKGSIIDSLEKKSIMKLLDKYIGKGHILDIPCGTGRLSLEFLKNGYTITGSDISYEMLHYSNEKLKSNGYPSNFLNSDAELLCFKSNAFDGAASLRFMGHLPDDTKINVIKELLRVSKKGAIVVIYSENMYIKLKKFIISLIKKKKFVWYPVRLEAFKKRLKKEGVEVVEHTYIFPVLLEGIVLYVKNV